MELAYVFNNLEDTIYTGEPADPDLAAAVQDMWVSFARTGDPSASRISWEPYDGVSRRTMILGDDIRMGSDPLPQQTALIEPLLKYHFNGQYRATDYALIHLRNQMLRANLIILGAALMIFAVSGVKKRVRVCFQNT